MYRLGTGYASVFEHLDAAVGSDFPKLLTLEFLGCVINEIFIVIGVRHTVADCLEGRGIRVRRAVVSWW